MNTSAYGTLTCTCTVYNIHSKQVLGKTQKLPLYIGTRSEKASLK